MSTSKLSEGQTGQPDLVYRSLPILASYLILAGSLALNACRTIVIRYQARRKGHDWESPQRRRQFLLFAILAALSLGATWFYMFAFFAHSYRNWEASQSLVDLTDPEIPVLFKLELWLQNARLFREAWETVIETPARFWWSGQIFLWTTGWSVFLGVMARRYRIPHVWAYMLLGQIVAISFAQNLFIATILVSRQPRPTESAKKDKRNTQDPVSAWTPPLYLEVLPVAISLISTVLVPTVAHTKYFMLMLLVPHLLLFVPAILRPSQSSTIETRAKNYDEGKSVRRYIHFFQWYTMVCVLIQAHSTFLVLQDMGQDISVESLRVLAAHLPKVIYEHPAVSSVSWDVIYCTVTAGVWIAVNGASPKRMLGHEKLLSVMSSTAEPIPVSNPPAASNVDLNPPVDIAPVADDVKVADTTTPTEVLSNDKLPSVDTIRKVEDYTVFDNKGEKHSFKSIYDGPGSTERVLVIFIRHFFCGSCQEYIRALAASIQPDELLKLPIPTSLAIIGCGDHGLIDFYAKETGCPFPIYADPANTLYDDLGMASTWALGPKPEYVKKNMARVVSESIIQGLKQFSSGLATKGGDTKRVGGEFFFEPMPEGGKMVSWCHRMKTTRDHTGVKELAKVLDKDGTVLFRTE
ncbi:Thioredoxin-like protein AAED1 [Penicillium rolfsii]|nr:Thioredoxin-like protein AAED1 [Penicillium rolfsii]